MIISATSHQVGNIMHSNEEIYHVLGFNSKDILGTKVDVLMPLQIGVAHDSFI